MENSNKILIIFAAVIFLSPGISAQEDRSIADLREEIEDMELTSAEKYFEVDDMRRKTVLMLYTIERVNVSADVKQFIFSVENFLNTFESTYVKSETGGVSEHRESIEQGSGMKKMASDIRLYKNNPELKEYPQVPVIADDADSAVKRFLDDMGAYFEDAAEYENVTPIKIKHIEDAIYAYEESENNEKKIEVRAVHEEINSEFLTDMNTAAAQKQEADTLLNKSDALKDSSNIIDLFSAFWSAADAGLKYGNIMKIYSGHNLDSSGCSENKECSLEYYGIFIEVYDKNEYASEISESLTTVILKYITVIAFIVLIILFIFKRSYSKYRADSKDAKLGVELGLDS